MIEGDEALHSALQISRKVFNQETPAMRDSPEVSSIENRTYAGKGYLSKVSDVCFYHNQCISMEPGQIIFQQGDPGDTMYVIRDGVIEVSQELEGSRCVLAYLGPHDYLGELALITGSQRTATAKVIKKAQMLEIKREDFLDRIQETPELALYILQVLIRRLRKTLDALTEPNESIDSVNFALPPLLWKKNKISVSLISLLTCSGCSSGLLNENEELSRILERADILYCPLLMDRDEIKEVEVALIDGVVRSKEDEERLKEARGKSRFLIAWGTCASFGGIPAMANPFELEELIEESYGQSLDPFSYYLSGTKGVTSVFYAENGLELLRTAHKIDDFVNVDYYIPGCPPPIKLVTQMIMELKGEPNAAPRRNIVCSECSRKFVKNTDDCFLVFPRQGWEQSQCFSSRGLCMGFMTRGGCGASCPSGALPCWGCRGPSDAVLNKISRGQSLESSMLESISRRNNLGGEKIKPVMDIIRRRSNSLISFYQNFNIDSSKIR